MSRFDRCGWFRGASALSASVLLATALLATSRCFAADAGVDAYLSGDYQGALQLLQPRAASGDPIAEFWLGVAYSEGHGVAQDQAEGLGWFEKAAAHGSADGALSAGRMVRAGQGTPADSEKAIALFRRGAELGASECMFELGMAYDLGQGVPHDYKLAAGWLRKAANRQNPKAQNQLAVMYEYGDGVIKDKAEALRLYKAAAAKGDEPSMARIGQMYADGDGVRQDYAEALRWLVRIKPENGQGKADLDRVMQAAHFPEATGQFGETVLVYQSARVADDQVSFVDRQRFVVLSQKPAWIEVYAPSAHVLGWIKVSMYDAKVASAAQVAALTGTAGAVRRSPSNGYQPSASNAGKVLRYSDHCFNGDCTRTFEDGHQVRFQAPYCYDAVSQQWAWKPDGC